MQSDFEKHGVLACVYPVERGQAIVTTNIAITTNIISYFMCYWSSPLHQQTNFKRQTHFPFIQHKPAVQVRNQSGDWELKNKWERMRLSIFDFEDESSQVIISVNKSSFPSFLWLSIVDSPLSALSLKKSATNPRVKIHPNKILRGGGCL